ncbi:MAG TPA: hypothetical protein VLD84_09255 [Nitrososphaeraceae archaeon]|nr:hypothetical protein [Nitrososphaeraceae archaeon]
MTAILMVGFIGLYQVESAEAQTTNTSSVSELIDEGNLLLNFERYTEALSLWFVLPDSFPLQRLAS